jgi:hypothetical protein
VALALLLTAVAPPVVPAGAADPELRQCCPSGPCRCPKPRQVTACHTAAAPTDGKPRLCTVRCPTDQPVPGTAHSPHPPALLPVVPTASHQGRGNEHPAAPAARSRNPSYPPGTPPPRPIPSA